MTTPLESLSYLQSALTSGQCQSMLTQNPDGTYNIAVDIGPGPSALELTPLQGNTGAAGDPQFALVPMPDVYDSPDDLPAPGVLTNTDADIGKFWIINQGDGTDEPCTSVGAYIWFGAEFRFLPFGSQGPAGPYPVIQPFVELFGPNHTPQISVAQGGTGSATNPYLLTTELSIPTGPTGQCCPLAEMPDVSEGTYLNGLTPPEVGQFLTYQGSTVSFDEQTLPVWEPGWVGTDLLQFYSVPQGFFTNTFGLSLSSYTTIATYPVPAQPWNWIPIVFGQMTIFEIELSFEPLLVGVEVLLGAPTVAAGGTLVARGYGNTLSGVVTIVPHTSSPAATTAGTLGGVQYWSPSSNAWQNVDAAVQPVPAGAASHLVSGQTYAGPTTLFINIVDDGLADVYSYNPSQAEFFVLACPVTTGTPTPVVGALHPKVTLTAASVYSGLLNGAFHGQGALTAVVHPKTVFPAVSGQGVLSAAVYPR